MANESDKTENADEQSAVPATRAEDAAQNESREDGDEPTDGEAEEDDAAFDDEALVAEPEAPAKRGPSLAALAALLLAIGALALSGWQLRMQPEAASGPSDATLEALSSMQDTLDARENAIDAGEETIDELRGELAPLEQSTAALQQQLAQLAAESEATQADIEAIERRLREQSDTLEALPGRINSVEQSVSALEGVSSGARGNWLLAQAEYFLQVANAELELSRNPGIAEQALQMADERLLSLGDPGLTDVRRAVSSELQALRSLEMPDTASTAVRLASLAEAVDSLPVRRELLTKRPEDDGSAASAAPSSAANEPELSGRARAMATLKNAFSGFVSVRRSDEEAEPLMAPEAAYFLRVNLGLQLQAARLALLSGEQALFQQSLDDAASWLRDYYDAESRPVQNALETIAEVRDTRISVELPDISASLRRLRQYSERSGGGNRSGPEASNEPQQ